MHICFVCREFIPSLRGGGIASYIKEMAEGLITKGHDVTVICASDNTKEESDTINDRNIRIIRLKGGDFYIPEEEKGNILYKFRPLYRYFSYRKRIRETIEQLDNIDIIEVPDFGGESYYLENMKIPVVIRLHTPSLFDRNTLKIAKYSGIKKLFYYIDKKELELINSANYVSSCSESLKQWCIDNIGTPEGKIEVIYNPIKIATQNTNYSDVIKSNNNFKVVFAGTISDVKGCGDLYEAGKVLKSKYGINVDIELYGKGGSYAKDLKSISKHDDWFKVCEKIDRESLLTVYKMADIVCFPSWWDNMPMVCIEAMLQKAIVLASNSGGMSEIITDGYDGFLVSPKNPEILAEKIYNILMLDKKSKCSISNNAYKRIIEGFSTDVIIDKTLDYYNKVIEDFKKHENTIR